MRQLPLFPFDPAPLESDVPAPEAPPAIVCPPAEPVANDGAQQLPLFSAWTGLSGALESALADADLAAAQAIRRQLEETYGKESAPDWTASLDGIRLDAWERGELGEVLHAWRCVVARLAFEPQRRAFGLGCWRRIFAVHAPEHVVAEDPALVPDVAEALIAMGETPRARRLVRDALLSGQEVLGIDDDPPVAALLAEDLAPRWLASLGAIRRLWPLPLPAAEERAVDDHVPADDGARAAAFWNTLRLAELRSALPEPVLYAARRRLKRLHPDLHAAYMSRTGPFA